jgi:hypothetical protein
LWACGGFAIFIYSEFKWKATTIPPPDLTTSPTDEETQRLIGRLRLEITLTGESPPNAKRYQKGADINRGALNDEAFQPKSFIVRIEDGSFMTPCAVDSPYPNLRGKSWTKRLVFDTSPYPPESEWKEDAYWGACNPDAGSYWDFKHFVSGFISKGLV